MSGQGQSGSSFGDGTANDVFQGAVMLYHIEVGGGELFHPASQVAALACEGQKKDFTSRKRIRQSFAFSKMRINQLA